MAWFLLDYYLALISFGGMIFLTSDDIAFKEHPASFLDDLSKWALTGRSDRGTMPILIVESAKNHAISSWKALKKKYFTHRAAFATKSTTTIRLSSTRYCHKETSATNKSHFAWYSRFLIAHIHLLFLASVVDPVALIVRYHVRAPLHFTTFSQDGRHAIHHASPALSCSDRRPPSRLPSTLRHRCIHHLLDDRR